MKTFHSYLKGVIAVGSLASFLGGWAMLAHAPKAVASNQPMVIVAAAATPWPTLPSLPTLQPLLPLPGESMPALAAIPTLQPLPSLPPAAPSQRAAVRRLRTRGS